MQIFAAIDLKDGKCVRLIQGVPEAETVYDEDPVAIAETWETIGVDWLHIVNLDGTFGDPEKSARNIDALQSILDRVTTPVQFSGGLRTLEDIKNALNMGASRVVIGSMAADRPRQMLDVIGQFGPEQIALGLDVKNGKVATHGWRQLADTKALDLVQMITTAGLKHVIYTEISREGTLAGVNLEAALALVEAGQKTENGEGHFKIILSGDITGLEDVKRAKAAEERGVEGLIIGKALYTGNIELTEAMQIAHNDTMDQS